MNKFNKLFNIVSDGICVYGPINNGEDFIFIDMNSAGEQISQVNINEIKGKTLYEVFPAASSLGLLDVIKDVYKTGKEKEIPYQLYKDNRISLFVHNKIIKVDDNIVVIFTDNSNLLNVQQELKTRLDFLDLLLKTIPIPIYCNDSDLRYVECNSAFEKFIGLPRSEIIGKQISDILSVPSEIESIINKDSELLKTSNSANFEMSLTTKNGKRDVLITKTPFFDFNCNSKGIIAAIVDVTNKVKTERIFRSLLSCSQIILKKDDFNSVIKYIFEISMKYTNSQSGFVGIYNIQSGTHKIILSEFGKQSCNINKSLAHGITELKNIMYTSREPKYINNFENTEMYKLIPEGHIKINNLLLCPFIHDDTIIGGLILANKVDDYTDDDLQIVVPLSEMAAISLNNEIMQIRLNDSENQLRQSQKMEAIGTLSGGISHDFNNILSIILGFAELALDGLEPNSKLFKNLKEIKTASLRAKDLIQHILSFSRRSDQKTQTVSIQYIVKESIGLIKSTIPSSIHLSFDSDPICKKLYSNVDPIHISQIIINLCTNSVHAMNSDGVLKVSVQQEQIMEYECNSLFEINPGLYVSIIVEDTGIGIPKENIDRIFDPYFTTKDIGHGSGMGLSIIYGIIKGYKGFIRVTSKPGNTKFEILISATLRHMIEDPIDLNIEPGFGERIMVVDDEKQILKLYELMLGRLNYSITTFSDSIDALTYFKDNSNSFDLIITDVAMPKLPGDKLSNRILNINPNIPIIMCTGHSSVVDETIAKEIGVRKFIHKPISKFQLSKAIREVLDNKNQ